MPYYLLRSGTCFYCILLDYANARFGWLVQPVNATHALNLSAGALYSNVLRGRLFNRQATALSFADVIERSVGHQANLFSKTTKLLSLEYWRLCTRCAVEADMQEPLTINQ